MSHTADQLTTALLEDTDSPFSKQSVILQYRPYRGETGWVWYWVLLPQDRSKALASGQQDNRALAAIAARREARKLKVTVAEVDVLKSLEHA